ncbi:MAG: hypothetical protein HC894_26660 [Microcoleus sp. SM1_3_4]|nr:hypothetical protein [Microcoleus sp. SM1_3_4]
MDKISIGTSVFDFPMPVTLLGTVAGGRANFMALGWLSRVNANPPLVSIGVGIIITAFWEFANPGVSALTIRAPTCGR